MVAIPVGTVTMGNDDGPEDEYPAHRVNVPAFSIDKNQMTNGGFAAFLNARGPINSKDKRLFDVDDDDSRVHLR